MRSEISLLQNSFQNYSLNMLLGWHEWKGWLPILSWPDSSASGGDMSRSDKYRPIQVKLPSFDYEGHAERLVKCIRSGESSLAEAIATAENYARDVRDIDCTFHAAHKVGDARVLSKKCGLRTEIIARYQQEAARLFLPSQKFTDRKLTRFLAGMFHELHAAQTEDAAKQAVVEADEALARGDELNARRWREAAQELEACWRSI